MDSSQSLYVCTASCMRHPRARLSSLSSSAQAICRTFIPTDPTSRLVSISTSCPRTTFCPRPTSCPGVLAQMCLLEQGGCKYEMLIHKYAGELSTIWSRIDSPLGHSIHYGRTIDIQQQLQQRPPLFDI